jgi:2-phosphosulfolactate phosphatase
LKITVYFSAAEVKPSVVAKSTVVYGDPLQLGSAVATFLYHGANAVSVFSDPASAKKAFAKLKRGEGLLAGERDGEKIPGFQMGGAPLDSARDKVKGRTICLSSPDAGPMLKAIVGAEKVFLGGFVNLGAVYESALRAGHDIVIVAAGHDGKPNRMDTIFAGLVADFLQNTVAGHPIELTDSARKAADEARQWQGRLMELLQDSEEGKLLIRVGTGKNLDMAAKLSRYSCSPVLINGSFVKEIPPKSVPRAPGEGVSAPAPRKGKPIKVQVPLFPKNPELPTPGAAVSKTAAPAAASKPAGTPEPSKKKGSKTPGKRAPLFSKKTVASMHVKVGMPVNPLVQAATDALKAALSKKDTKNAAPVKVAKGVKPVVASSKAVAVKGKAEVKKPVAPPAKVSKKPLKPSKPVATKPAKKKK